MPSWATSNRYQQHLFLLRNYYPRIIIKYPTLIFTTLWVNLADNKLIILFLFFRENRFDIFCKLSPMEMGGRFSFFFFFYKGILVTTFVTSCLLSRTKTPSGRGWKEIIFPFRINHEAKTILTVASPESMLIPRKNFYQSYFCCNLTGVRKYLAK